MIHPPLNLPRPEETTASSRDSAPSPRPSSRRHGRRLRPEFGTNQASVAARHRRPRSSIVRRPRRRPPRGRPLRQEPPAAGGGHLETRSSIGTEGVAVATALGRSTGSGRARRRPRARPLPPARPTESAAGTKAATGARPPDHFPIHHQADRGPQIRPIAPSQPAPNPAHVHRSEPPPPSLVSPGRCSRLFALQGVGGTAAAAAASRRCPNHHPRRKPPHETVRSAPGTRHRRLRRHRARRVVLGGAVLAEFDRVTTEAAAIEAA